jgi:alkanesulfonate monooxygenase SsuD/methylene tetrahydromethanopterin reductase-like flavin-dependent oxidoreductase (luciferase family)
MIVGRETVDEMKRFYDAFKARVRQHGRAPEACKIFFLAKPIIADTDKMAQQRAEALYANAPVEAGLAALSTLLQIDLSTYALDEPLPATLQPRAIQGIRSQLERFYQAGRTPTLREIATRKVSLDSMPFIGTPQHVADSLARTIEAVGGDGFAIRQGLWPGYVGPFVEQVVPLLQQRGVARAEYAGTTLREHLQEF